MRKYVKLTTGGAPLPRSVNKERKKDKAKDKSGQRPKKKKKRKS